MGYHDLRGYLDRLDEEGHLVHVNEEVDWRGEVGAVIRKTFDTGGPALLFENIKDHPNQRLLTGALFTFERYGIGLGLPKGRRDVRTCIRTLMDAMDKPIDPVVVKNGPCKENVIVGDEIDVEKFPTPLWHPLDGGRYLGTLGCVVVKDPDTGARNIGVYRSVIQGKKTLGLNATQQLGIILAKYLAKGEDMPVAMAIGVGPAELISAVVSARYGFDEYRIAGGISGRPINLVKCESVDLEVPATAEIVLEGFVPADREKWGVEGPFGEFTGYYGGAVMKRPSMAITAVTHRDDPILQGTLEGKPPSESSTMRTVSHTAAAWRRLADMSIPGFKEIYLTDMGCSLFIAVASMDRHYHAGSAKQLIRAIQSSRTIRTIKWVIIVDDDIDIFDRGQVEWALATRVQPHRDIEVTSATLPATDLDPSIEPSIREWPNSLTSSIGIDATKYFKGFSFPVQAEPTKEDTELVDKRWEKYGVSSKPLR